ncbi:MAG TPA: hypothetical protein VM575_18875 [Nocardioides sp.]|nr:hypothetical protein [Nocardioides sp.]
MRSRVSSLPWRAVVLLSAVLVAGCDDAPDAGAGDGGPGERPLPREVSESRAAASCTRAPKVTDDGYTAPGSNLCIGATARLPYSSGSDQKPVPVDVTVTSVEPSTDAGFDPSNEDLEGLPIWVYRFTVSSPTTLDSLVDPWPVIGGMWTADGGGTSVLFVAPDDCVLPIDLAAGATAKGCKWAAMDHGSQILGISWVTVDDERYSGIGESIDWKLDDPVTVP